MNVDNWRVKRDPSEIPPKEQTPNRSFQHRKSGNNGYDRNHPSGRSPAGPPRDSIRKPYDDQRADLAIEEGRRLYVGNMPYEATVKDVESLFKDLADRIESINMSVDPMTGRNPSYCFVDFVNQQTAQLVMEEYNGHEFLRRPLKVKPGVKSGQGRGPFHLPPNHKKEENTPPFDRWRRWETPEHLGDPAQEGRRLYVGGLPRFESQDETSVEIRELFQEHGFKVQVISKLVSPHESRKGEPGNLHFCFVDLESSVIADQAIQALDGLDKWDWTLKVNKARGTSGKVAERRRLYVGGLPDFGNTEATESSIKELFTGYDIQSISKLFAPKEERANDEGNHHFCFVEIANGEQTDAAVAALDWKEMWGGNVRVKPALGNAKPPHKSREWGQSR